MNVAQLRDLLKEVARQKEQAGDAAAVEAIGQFDKAVQQHNKKSVAALAELIKSSLK